MFLSDLAARMKKRVPVSSDSLAAYADAMERGFEMEVDSGQISKTYSFVNLSQNAAERKARWKSSKLNRQDCLEC